MIAYMKEEKSGSTCSGENASRCPGVNPLSKGKEDGGTGERKEGSEQEILLSRTVATGEVGYKQWCIVGADPEARKVLNRGLWLRAVLKVLERGKKGRAAASTQNYQRLQTGLDIDSS